MRIPFPEVTIFRESVEVDAPPERVFARLADVANWASWSKQITAARLRSTGPLARGSRLSFTPKIARGLPLHVTVLEHEPARSLAWGLEVLGAGLEHRFDLVPLGTGRTRVDQHEYAWGVVALLTLPAGRAIRAFDRRMGDDLRRAFMA